MLRMIIVAKNLRALARRAEMLEFALPESLFRFKVNAPTCVPLFELPPTLATRQPGNGVMPKVFYYLLTFQR
jgi:hypothetical protein